MCNTVQVESTTQSINDVINGVVFTKMFSHQTIASVITLKQSWTLLADSEPSDGMPEQNTTHRIIVIKQVMS